MRYKELFLMPCLFAVFEICHRSHSPLCSLFQIPKPTKIQVKIGQLILSPLLSNDLREIEHTRKIQKQSVGNFSYKPQQSIQTDLMLRARFALPRQYSQFIPSPSLIFLRVSADDNLFIMVFSRRRYIRQASVAYTNT